ncbi:MAG: hypothetical protein AAF226_15575, partial [Verrucomicrobiota bacterium]
MNDSIKRGLFKTLLGPLTLNFVVLLLLVVSVVQFGSAKFEDPNSSTQSYIFAVGSSRIFFGKVEESPWAIGGFGYRGGIVSIKDRVWVSASSSRWKVKGWGWGAIVLQPSGDGTQFYLCEGLSIPIATIFFVSFGWLLLAVWRL